MSEDDVELVEALRAGRREAFALLVERHRQRALDLALAVLGNRAEAEDVVQEATYQAYLDIGQLRRPDSFGAWLCGIAVNLSKMALRRRRLGPSLSDPAGGRYFPTMELPADQSPELAYEMRELGERISRALETLSPEMRAAVWLHYVEGMTYQEVAALTGIPAGRLRVLSHRARRRLQEELAAEWRPRLTRGRAAMIEVTVHDVSARLRRPADKAAEDKARTPTTWPFAASWAVTLKSTADDAAISIWVGVPEGEALAMHLADVAPPRPPTYVFMTRLVEALGGRVEAVTIAELTNDTFIALVTLRTGGRAVEVDARSSDALNLALRSGAKIFVAEDVMERAGFHLGDKPAEAILAKGRELFGPDMPDFELRPGIEVIREESEKWLEAMEQVRKRREAMGTSGEERAP